MREQFRKLLGLDEPPRRTAIAFSIGVFLGFSPFLGLHTLLGLAVAFLFGFNRVAVLLGVWSNNPWIVVPYYAFAGWVGYELLGLPRGSVLPEPSFSEVFTLGFWAGVFGRWELLKAAFVGSLLLSAVLAVAIYPVTLHLVRRYGRRKRPPATREEAAA